LTLKGLIYAPTGAMLAAATTSLPETPGGERNYDYRYSWLRDSTFLLWGLYTLGLDREAIDYFYFLTDLADEDPDLQIMYGIGGERELTEQILDHLSGYDGARPVRIGNAAWDQRQRDVWGCCSTRCTCTSARATSSTSGAGRYSRHRWTLRWSTGANPTRHMGSSSSGRRCSAILVGGGGLWVVRRDEDRHFRILDQS
jgi:GH15 family glucan-1,4-alpha-glucosidase